ncbi:hypothetical protein [Methylobacterium nigriterrae]|uniref:hypothetical protein n=1 Tax=Methylobacterium nigriterrae TaxID=3127512 RepID=UPI003013B6CC
MAPPLRWKALSAEAASGPAQPTGVRRTSRLQAYLASGCFASIVPLVGLLA